ncbi:MAG: glycine--tRNA ligase subunit beta [Alphaproteobacteria bacterium]
MAELLLELLSEEIPARMQTRAADDLKRLVNEALSSARVAFERAEAFATPRRIALVVDGLPSHQPDLTEEKRGPRVGAPDKAVGGFLKANGLDSLDQCEQRETDKGAFWFAVIDRKGQPIAALLPGLIGTAIGALAWPKSMRWGTGSMRWVRPLQHCLCLCDGAPIAIETTEPVATGADTVGHRFHAPDPIPVSGFDEYQTKLRAAKVMLDPAERRAVIAKRAAALATAEGLRLADDPALLDEIVGLVEWPVPLIGAIDEAFMGVPPEVLTTAMRTHQRYFALERDDGTLAPRFVVVANIEAPDGGAAIVAGNERVLRARLSDAKFFWDQDRKQKLESRVPALGQILFHAKLGTLAQKVERIQALAAELVPSVPGADIDQVRSAATLAKADLTTGMVGEFPELQGVMGRYYALEEGEKAAVAQAIEDHYKPAGPDDGCPAAPVGVAVALADKLDTLIGFFGIGEPPTGSRDPFALRRAALGCIRLILENGLRVNLWDAFTQAYTLYARPPASAEWDRDAVVGALLDFFADRLKVHLRTQGVRHDLISAVFALGDEDDLVRLLARVSALETFLATDDGANLLVAHKRASHIVSIEEKRDGIAYDSAPEEALLAEEDERALYAALQEVRLRVDPELGAERFDDAMKILAGLRQPVDRFFDRVTVNCDAPELRANRLRILARINDTMAKIADFSKIEGQ